MPDQPNNAHLDTFTGPSTAYEKKSMLKSTLKYLFIILMGSLLAVGSFYLLRKIGY